MNIFAVILVVISALLHSFWNLLSKKSENKSAFNWLMIASASVIYFPAFVYFIFSEKFQTIGWLFIFLSSISTTFYFYFLGKTYSHGHLSLTYPVARSSVIFVPFLAILLIKEQLSITGILGIIIALLGIYVLHLKSFKINSFLEPLKYIKEKATIFALLTALFSAFYSITDKIGVEFVFPLIYIYLLYLFTTVFYFPVAFSKNNRKYIKTEWNENKKSILLSGFLVVLSYILILYAFRIDKVTYVVSLRQLSVVFGAILGTFILNEQYGKIRIVASIIMFAGFFLVAIS